MMLRTEASKTIWLTGINALTERLPRISYFPTFLFDLPDKIYLDGNVADGSKYYCEILQDIFDSQGEGLKLQTHILDRIANYSAGAFPEDTKHQIDAVFRKMEAELNRVIFGAWNDIFKNRPKNKDIAIEWGLDASNKNRPYCRFYINDGQDKYSLSERSLGFRWFFCFLLFTQFGTARGQKRKTYFLFDEPASNLHSLAQLRLLESFPKVAGQDNVIIYSTHSHHMIQPLWLENAYIVTNKAIAYTDDFDAEFSETRTDISLQRYRSFVNQFPDRTSYFQPIIERLDYAVSPLIGTQPCLIVEGKQDYAAMRYFLPQLGCENIDILPGVGAHGLDTLLSLVIGWGRCFLVLLDDDSVGRAERQRYIDDYLLNESAVVTLGDIGPDLVGKKLEGLFSDQFADTVRATRQLDRYPTKKDFARLFQERLAQQPVDGLPDTDTITRQRMQQVADFVRAKLCVDDA